MKAVVVADGAPADGDADELSDAALVIAADGGAGWLDQLGRRPDLLVGDLDSVDAELVRRLEADGTGVERHPAAKEASDTELAVERAVAAGARRVVVLGALGGARLDHELANLLLMADPAWRARGVAIEIVRDGTRVRALQGGERLALHGRAGTLVTLIPIGGDAEGVRTEGLEFALHGEPLRLGRSRGLSNVVRRRPAAVALEGGTLLVVETQSGEEKQ